MSVRSLSLQHLRARAPPAALHCTAAGRAPGPSQRRLSSSDVDAPPTLQLELDAASAGLPCGAAGVAVLTLCRPAARNALSVASLAELSDACSKLRAAPSGAVRAVVLRSSVDKVFCAGADLKERLAMPECDVAPHVDRIRACADAVAALPMPTIAALDGAAFGGGLELALACDLRYAGFSAKLGLPETKLAIIPGAGGTQRLPRLVGPSVAKELIFTGRILSGTEAAEVGLVNGAVSDGTAFEKALEIAAGIAANSGPLGLRAAKRAIDTGLALPLAEGLAFEGECYRLVVPTADRLEGLKAFTEKRAPVYAGN